MQLSITVKAGNAVEGLNITGSVAQAWLAGGNPDQVAGAIRDAIRVLIESKTRAAMNDAAAAATDTAIDQYIKDTH